MDITTGVTVEEQPRLSSGRPVSSAPARPAGAYDPGFAQSIQQAAGQPGVRQGALSTQPQTEPTYENMHAQAGGLPGVTPLTPNELGLRETAMELETRQLAFNWARRLTSPANIADYPQTAVNFAGQLAGQVNQAGFAMPESSSRVFSTPRRGGDARPVPPVDAPEEGHRSQTIAEMT